MLRREHVAALVASLLVPACGGPAPPPAPPSLGYDAVGVPSAAFLMGDTSRVEVDAGGQTIEATVASGATLDVGFRSSPEGVTVSASFRDYSARATNPMGAAQTATGESIQGPLVFTLDRRGAATLVSSPEIGDDVARFLSPEATAVTLFPRLPGRAVQRGATWTDTVHVDATQSTASVTGTSVITYTVAGDTVVAGLPLLKVGLSAEDHRVLTGNQTGMQVSQTLDGSSTGWFLWDTSQGLLHESVYDSDLSGTMEVDVAPYPLSIRVRSSKTLRLAGGPGEG